MKLLALETTEKYGSVALLDDNNVLAEAVLPKNQRSSQTLHPALHSLFLESQIAATEIDAVAVVAGPGSFTGLRVGVTAAKVFAYAIGAKIVVIDTFQAVASAAPTHSGMISVGVDAQRGEAVVAVLRRSEFGQAEMVEGPALIAVEDWWKHIDRYEDVLFTGPALEKWSGKVPSHLVLADEADWFPKASIAGKLAVERVRLTGQYDDVWSLLPIYSRLSAAEEKRNAGE
ncbi:MAG: tRNA (adenosine(37)-N6)-threonylcarbamoyltransferase complex dimerization subunit type 1 TsaB [Planctomycetaceae bacterium]|nr:tRNA (adenosine(37)-N6)-threonylcarbamoyltransferase complex dimerization subunit type 1 TsaB [Planctomycetaceae bacterium]